MTTGRGPEPNRREFATLADLPCGQEEITSQEADEAQGGFFGWGWVPLIAARFLANTSNEGGGSTMEEEEEVQL